MYTEILRFLTFEVLLLFKQTGFQIFKVLGVFLRKHGYNFTFLRGFFQPENEQTLSESRRYFQKKRKK